MADAQQGFNDLEKYSIEKSTNVKTQLSYYKLFWVDANVKSPENQFYVMKFKNFGFIDVSEFTTVDDCVNKLD